MSNYRPTRLDYFPHRLPLSKLKSDGAAFEADVRTMVRATGGAA